MGKVSILLLYLTLALLALKMTLVPEMTFLVVLSPLIGIGLMTILALSALGLLTVIDSNAVNTAINQAKQQKRQDKRD